MANEESIGICSLLGPEFNLKPLKFIYPGLMKSREVEFVIN